MRESISVLPFDDRWEGLIVRFTIIEDSDDIQWMKDTCLKGVTLPTSYKDFKFAILEGNEDSPDAVILYLSDSPDFDDDYYRIVFKNDGLIYAECLEYNGKTNKPYGGFNEVSK